MDSLMTLWAVFIGIILGIIIGVSLSFRTAVTPLQQHLETVQAQKERFDDLKKYYPYNLENFRFIGSPVDGIQFEDDRILFVRIAGPNTSRTTEQDRIRHLLEHGKVGWFEFMTK